MGHYMQYKLYISIYNHELSIRRWLECIKTLSINTFWSIDFGNKWQLITRLFLQVVAKNLRCKISFLSDISGIFFTNDKRWKKTLIPWITRTLQLNYNQENVSMTFSETIFFFIDRIFPLFSAEHVFNLPNEEEHENKQIFIGFVLIFSVIKIISYKKYSKGTVWNTFKIAELELS